MKKNQKVAAAAGAFLIASAVLSACGKDAAVQTSASSKDYVYKVEELQLGDIDIDSVSSVYKTENGFAVEGYIYSDQGIAVYAKGGATMNGAQAVMVTEEIGAKDVPAEEDTGTEEGTEETGTSDEPEKEEAPDQDPPVGEEPAQPKAFYATFDLDAKQLSYVEKTQDSGKNEYENASAHADDGSSYAVMESNEVINDDPDNYESKQLNYLVKRTVDGEEEWRVDLEEYKGVGPDDYFYVNTMCIDAQGQIYLFTGSGVLVFSQDSSFVKKIELTEDINNVFTTDDGKFIASIWGENGQTFKTIDPGTGALSETYKIPGNSYSYSVYRGYGYDLFLSDSLALYGYNLGDESLKTIMNFVDSDLDTNSIYNIVGISETQFYGMYYDSSEGGSHFAKFTKVDPKDVPDKKFLTLGVVYVNMDVKSRVIKFNKTNTEYRIQIRDYSMYNTEEDYSLAGSKLNTDIVSGNIPDILLLDESMPVNSYIAKGLFEDLYPYIDNDPDMQRSDFLENILKAYESDGKLYQLVPAFDVMTVVGKTSIVGAEPGWTLEDLNALMAQQPEGTEIFFDQTKESILNYSMRIASKQFIDWEAGKCYFDSDAFIAFLDFIKQFPDEIDYTKYEDESFWNSYDSMYRNNKVLLNVYYFNNFSSWNYLKKGTFGEDITMIGFPAGNKNGSSISSSTKFAISSKSAGKEGAWQFIRYFLTKDYQKEIYNWPLRLDCLDDMAQQAKKKPTYTDENGKEVEYTDTMYVAGMEVEITPMTDEEIQQVMDFLKSLDQTSVYDSDLLNIISEESAAYFSGQKSAQDVAAVIQSRAQIYVNESR